MPMNSTGYRLVAATGMHRGDRAYQQDRCASWATPAMRDCALAVVVDGMGGKAAGARRRTRWC